MLVGRARVRTPVVHDADRTPMARAFGIGVFQALALIPGVSRSGATIVGGLLMRLDRARCRGVLVFSRHAHDGGGLRVQAVGSAGSPRSRARRRDRRGLRHGLRGRLVVVESVSRFVGRSGFAPFAWYRIVVGVLILAAAGSGWL